MSGSTVVAEFTAAMETVCSVREFAASGRRVSGGADSMALCLLARDWAVARGGRVTALTVDHRLRPASAKEAAQVGRVDVGARHRASHSPLAGREAGERPSELRACRPLSSAVRVVSRQTTVLHLLLGHHADDQSETVLHRLVRGSGIVRAAGNVGSRRDRARSGCCGRCCGVVGRLCARFLTDTRRGLARRPEQPGSAFRQDAFARLIDRLSTPSALVGPSFSPRPRDSGGESALQASGRGAAGANAAAFTRWASRRSSAAAMATAPIEIGAKALARVVMMIGGSASECSVDRARRCYQELFGGPDRRTDTLGRCLLVDQGSDLLVCRERRNLPPPQILCSPGEILWDGRFRLKGDVAGRGCRYLVCAATVGRRLGEFFARAPTKLRDQPSLPLVCGTLPVLCDEGGLAIAPQLWYAREDLVGLPSLVVEVVWRPRNGITGRGYFLL